MDANSLFRILVGIILLVGGLGWAVLVVGATAMSDTPHDNSMAVPALIGLGVALLGAIALVLPLIHF